MNDTETEARRLLAAATDHMPPGIDLLGGFAAARHRDRARRTRGRAAASAGIAVAAVSVTAAILTTGSASPALAAATSALTRTLAQSYQSTEQVSSYYIWNGRITDPVRHLEASSCSGGGSYREVGKYTYIYIIDPVGHGDKHWWRTPTASIGHFPTINGFSTATPQQMLSEIKKADKVTVAGPASGPGWTGTRYAFSGSPAQGERISGTVDVDQQGRTRSLAFTNRSTGPINVFVMTQILTFSGFGAPVTVTPPPADQTFSGP